MFERTVKKSNVAALRAGFAAAVLAVAMLLGAGAAHAEKAVKIGVISDLSGATSAVGVPYAEGVMDAVKYLNEIGYIPGVTIEAMQVDYAYNVQQALSAYKKFKSQGMVALQGWGSGDTEALVSFVARDEIPVLSASYSAHLTDPKKAPYNFFISADYSTQLRAALKYIKEELAESDAPKLAFIYPDNPYGLAPMEAGREYARELGFEIVGEENVDLKAMDATSQLLALQKVQPEFVWVGGTTPSTAVIMKDAAKLGMKATFFTNIWGADENIFKLAPQASSGSISLQASVTYDADTEGARLIRERTGGAYQMTHFIRGFASMYVMAEAIRLAAEQGEITGPAIKDALESLRDFDPLGLTPPVSFYEDDHRPNMAVTLYRIEDGAFVDLGTQTLERKKEWLGK
ncbi:ABC transporter substrate-binding protein [Oceanidesulfovibrio indonesiensis]|uniref:ABC transporter substrate-binding protein n=1 Tax=Oceanidesulfovibrio indonesiensis TaxID=54767 RepID=A0A7M3MDT4_9BACT|nr:ABC transporter substrate-binding protein [Oceanidesulfovibrio indonesiensis]TVM16852.1 ABC transporter substrate-binding protein [Oceanidesulfovibrio indonesiensis]